MDINLGGNTLIDGYFAGIVVGSGSGGSYDAVLSSNIAYVTPTGNDGTGAIGNNALPYLTAQAAWNAVYAAWNVSGTTQAQPWKISFAAGTYAGITPTANWPVQIQVGGAGAATTKLGGIDAGTYTGTAQSSAFNVALVGDCSIDLGNIMAQGNYGSSEFDELAMTGSPSDLDTWTIASHDASLTLIVVYSASIAFASSSLTGSTLTIGISDGPTNNQIAALVSTTMNGLGFNSLVPFSGTTIYNYDFVPSHWPLALSGAQAGIDATLTNIHAGSCSSGNLATGASGGVVNLTGCICGTIDVSAPLASFGATTGAVGSITLSGAMTGALNALATQYISAAYHAVVPTAGSINTEGGLVAGNVAAYTSTTLAPYGTVTMTRTLYTGSIQSGATLTNSAYVIVAANLDPTLSLQLNIISGNMSLAVATGTTGTTVCAGNDSRLPLAAPIKADLAGKTAAVTSIVTTTPGAAESFLINGYINVSAYTSGSVQLEVTFTDENSNARTLTMTASLTATGFYSATPTYIRSKASSAVTVKTIFSGTLTYDVGAIIERKS